MAVRRLRSIVLGKVEPSIPMIEPPDIAMTPQLRRQRVQREEVAVPEVLAVLEVIGAVLSKCGPIVRVSHRALLARTSYYLQSFDAAIVCVRSCTHLVV